jgi:cell division protein FtsL
MRVPDQSARLVREPDRRLLRTMGAAVALSGCLVAAVLGVVGLRVSQVRLSYRLEQLRDARVKVEAVNRQLRVELATLRALARVEAKARGELGMQRPSREQVRMAREYVAGGGGTASIRTAWEEPMARGRPRAR